MSYLRPGRARRQTCRFLTVELDLHAPTSGNGLMPIAGYLPKKHAYEVALIMLVCSSVPVFGFCIWLIFSFLITHRLLQENSVYRVAIHTLRNRKNYRVPFARTNRFKNSFLLYGLRNFQWVILNSLSVIYIAYWHFIECIGLLVCYCHFIQP